MQGAEQLYNTYVSLEGLGMEMENTASPFLPCSTKHSPSGLFTVLPHQTPLLLGAVLWGLAGLLAALRPFPAPPRAISHSRPVLATYLGTARGSCR